MKFECCDNGTRSDWTRNFAATLSRFGRGLLACSRTKADECESIATSGPMVRGPGVLHFDTAAKNPGKEEPKPARQKDPIRKIGGAGFNRAGVSGNCRSD